MPGFATVNEQRAGVCGEGQVVTERSVPSGCVTFQTKLRVSPLTMSGSVDWAAEKVRVLNSGSGVVVDKGLVRSMKAVGGWSWAIITSSESELSIWYASVAFTWTWYLPGVEAVNEQIAGVCCEGQSVAERLLPSGWVTVHV